MFIVVLNALYTLTQCLSFVRQTVAPRHGHWIIEVGIQKPCVCLIIRSGRHHLFVSLKSIFTKRRELYSLYPLGRVIVFDSMRIPLGLLKIASRICLQSS